jgi:hypothetical protein
MDEGAGATVADCTPHHLDGVVSLGTAAWATGTHGGAFSFDGKTCLDMGTSPAFGVTTAFTVAYWISPHSFPASGNAAYVIAKRTYGAESGWRVGFRSAMPAVEVGIPGGKVELVASAGLVAGKWAHVAATFTPNHLSIYVGGVLAGARADAPDAVIDQDVGTHVGCSADANPTVFGNADIDDLRVYSRALSDAEIAAIAK